MDTLDFPLWVRLIHWFHFLFISLLVRSGIEILAAHPKLYWSDHSLPEQAWLKLTRKRMPKDRLWTSADEEEDCPAWLGLPGHHNLGLGRYWHFAAVLGWLACGALYLILMVADDSEWLRLVPTSWQIIPEAWRSFTMYATFRLPEPPGAYNYEIDLPFNALQQLTYFGVIFVLSPIMILTGLAMSPALAARFPWYIRLFGGKQSARSLHFLGLVAFVVFFAGHMLMVVAHGIPTEMGKMVLGEEQTENKLLATALGSAIVVLVIGLNVVATVVSLHWPRSTHTILSAVVGPIRNTLLHRSVSVQHLPEEWISPYFRVNGYPPISDYPQAKEDDCYERLLAGNFVDYRLEITGLVEQPLTLSLADVRALPKQEQVTLHNCIQGWSSIGKWGGVPLVEVLRLCRPTPEAKFLAFHSFSRHEKSGAPYYECIDIALADYPETILAYELNNEPLPPEYRAP